MNLPVEVRNKTNDWTCPDWQALCVPDLNGGNGSLRLFTEGDDLHDAMISAIEGAQRSIRLEVFIFAADEIGWRFAKALSLKARGGVDVRFHYDSRGAATRYSPDLFREMVDAGDRRRMVHHRIGQSGPFEPAGESRACPDCSRPWARRGVARSVFQGSGRFVRSSALGVGEAGPG